VKVTQHTDFGVPVRVVELLPEEIDALKDGKPITQTIIGGVLVVKPLGVYHTTAALIPEPS